MAPRSGLAKGGELVIPNPKLKLTDQVREVLRVNRWSIRTCCGRAAAAWKARWIAC